MNRARIAQESRKHCQIQPNGLFLLRSGRRGLLLLAAIDIDKAGLCLAGVHGEHLALHGFGNHLLDGIGAPRGVGLLHDVHLKAIPFIPTYI